MKSLLAANLIIMLILLFSSFKKEPTNLMMIGTKKNAAIAPPDCRQKFLESFTPESLRILEAEKITFDQAKQMSLDYALSVGFIKPSGLYDMSRGGMSVTFSLEKMKALIYAIETKVCAGNCHKDRRMGIRFYFGKYPKSVGPGSAGTFVNLPANYAYKHTLFMTPAFLEGGKWFDFNPYAYDPCFVKPIVNNPQVFFIMPHPGLPGPAGNDDQDNHGGIAPPPGNGIFSN